MLGIKGKEKYRMMTGKAVRRNKTYLWQNTSTMYRKIIPALLALALLNACKNSGGDKSATKDSTGHDHMDHSSGSGTVPPLPEVPAGAKVVFSNLMDRAVITTPFTLQMGAEGMKIDTAGPVVAGSGHHHLLINAGDSIPAGQTIPADSAHVHFGKGQTEYELKLPPGSYHLTLQMADGLHRSYGSKLATSISIIVKK